MATTAWETEDEGPAPTVVSLPTPADTPYRTPSHSSRKSRRSVTPPGKNARGGRGRKSTSRSGDRSDKATSKRSSRDVSNDENISILDPRRFTPTLHANLVSEILALRRDQEEKTKIIESLETSLHATREEAEGLQGDLVSTAKESRSLKRQLALLEGGTSSALGELARERDEAVDAASETKKRLEAAQKKLRSREEDSERVHDQWANEKDGWEEERRKYERKIHVSETRLKVLLEEIAAYQAAQQQDAAAESETEDAKDNDAASTRSMSMTNSIRFSVATVPGKPMGHSLADELNFDDGDDDETDYGRESVVSMRHNRTTSRDSVVSRTHRRNQSIESLMRPASVARGRLGLHYSTLERLEGEIIEEDDETATPAPKVPYTDTGIQYSPPPSPKLTPTKPELLASRGRLEMGTPPRVEWEIEANQRRKRVHAGRPVSIEPLSMVNGSCQTVEEPPSPPKTPREEKEAEKEPEKEPEKGSPPMISASTQTDPPPLRQPSPPPSLPIPSISIIPPTSRPSTPKEPRLPQLTKDFGCQVSLLVSVPTQTAAVQTEEIRIDKRLDRLPAHLHPSAISSRPTSPAASPTLHDLSGTDEARQFTPLPGNVPPPRNPRRLAGKSSFTELPPSSPPLPPSQPLLPMASPILEEEKTHDAYPGNNDDGPLSSHRGAPMRRPHRISSLFAGFDAGGSSDEMDEFGDVDMSDSEYRTALSAPRPRTGGSRQSKRSSGGFTTSPEQPAVPPRAGGGRNTVRAGGSDMYSAFAIPEGREDHESGLVRPGKQSATRSGSAPVRPGVMRKAAMIQNSIATHQRARSPSLPEAKEPPFPIPTRASSRKPPLSVSAPSDGRASPTRGADASWQHRRGGMGGRNHYRAGSIRKVRSAAVLPRNHQRQQQQNRRQSSRSPPPFSPPDPPETPDLPPLPSNDITTPQNRNRDGYSGRYRSHRSQPSSNTADTGVYSAGSSGAPAGNQATTVVDAIAQTMVGEWMFKYVRRRKSFGVSEGRGGDDSSNDRHKRWVWLAPYERSILWSSKQPASENALLGRSGRKLVIQSVLDVKDDNLPPKGAGPVFNRSILILTPQRALKFTATSAERHYIWLTSLSFLAHSQQDVPEIMASAAQPKPPPEQFALPPAKIRKTGIRDSIRIAKGRGNGPRPLPPPSIASSHTDSAPPSIPSYRPPPLQEPFAPLPSHAQFHQREISRDTAEPPAIPRFHDRANQVTVHGRKRSNTGGHVPPPLSFRGFSGPAGSVVSSHHAPSSSTAGNSIGTAGSSDIYNNSQASSGGNMTWALSTTGGGSAGSVRTSEASSRPSGAAMNNFFDAIGTVRMEAFISPLAFSRGLDGESYEHDDGHSVAARRRSKELRRRASGSRQRDSYHSRGTRGTDSLDEWYTRDDPFRGF